MGASAERYLEIVKALLAAGSGTAGALQGNGEGKGLTALMLASAEEGHLVVKVLLAAGADAAVETSDGKMGGCD
jgi:hypothetical protein